MDGRKGKKCGKMRFVTSYPATMEQNVELVASCWSAMDGIPVLKVSGSTPHGDTWCKCKCGLIYGVCGLTPFFGKSTSWT